MENYVIEGTISEIKIEGTNCTFKICGAEGYSVKHGDKKYNVLTPNTILEDSKKEEKTEKIVITIIFSQNQYLPVSEDNKNLLIQTNSLGKHVKIEFEIDENKKINEISTSTISDFKIKSITLLSD